MKKEAPVIELSFQDIDASVLADILPQRGSRYNALYQGLKTKIDNALSPFLFRAKSKLDEKEIHSLESSGNQFLKRDRINWRIKYSVKAKAFACFPVKPRKTGYMIHRSSPVQRQKSTMDVNEFIHLAEKTLKLNWQKEKQMGHRQMIKALCFVGMRVCGINGNVMSETLGYSHSAGSFFSRVAMDDSKAKDMIEVLIKAVQQQNGGSK